MHPNEERYQAKLEEIVRIANDSFPMECGGQFNRGSRKDAEGNDQWFVGIIICRKDDHEIVASVRMYLDDGKFDVASPASAEPDLMEQASKVQAALRAAHFHVFRDEFASTLGELDLNKLVGKTE